MHLYLSGYVGAGTDNDPFRPVGSDQPGWSAIDLRPDATSVAGYAVLTVPTRPGDESGMYYLGDAVGNSLPDKVRRDVEDALGLARGDLRDVPFTDILADVLVLFAGAYASLCPPLRAGRDGWSRIRLAGQEIWSLAPVAGGATITESFNQTDSTTLGPDLSWTETSGDFETASNQARPVSTANAFAEARAESDLASADHYVQAVLSRGGSGNTNTDMRVLARFASGARTHYGLSYGATGGNPDQFYKRVAGTFTALTSLGDTAFADGDTVRFALDGSTLTAYANGVVVGTQTDTSITTGTRAGIAGRRDNVSAYIDDFAAGDLTYGDDLLSAGDWLGVWRLDETSGPSFVDASGNGNTGTGSGTLDATAAALVNDSVSAVDFGGGQISCGAITIGPDSRLTVAAWVQTSTATGVLGIMDRDSGSGTSRQFQFRLNAGKPEFIVFLGGSARTVAGASSIADGSTHFVVGTIEPDGLNRTVTLYVDGSSVDSGTWAGNLASGSTTPVLVGSGRGGAFDGVVDFAAYGDITLTSAQVSDLYAAGNPTSTFAGTVSVTEALDTVAASGRVPSPANLAAIVNGSTVALSWDAA